VTNISPKGSKSTCVRCTHPPQETISLVPRVKKAKTEVHPLIHQLNLTFAKYKRGFETVSFGISWNGRLDTTGQEL